MRCWVLLQFSTPGLKGLLTVHADFDAGWPTEDVLCMRVYFNRVSPGAVYAKSP